ncbi:helicase HerA-like domain-containing protein [Treponema pedis]|uniref:helicase HerA-like domain-containing protein n=1 Tax=Treponema pedis TaxID=409322 RepID=UPI00040108A6|nr:helicase HerA-like domain-containing protein [Treponema pedis]
MPNIFLGRGETAVELLPSKANRHALIAGATGTGKTVTLKVIAEAFSSLGIPVFLPDIKGDLLSFAEKGESSVKLQERLSLLKLNNFQFRTYPIRVWSILNETGHQIRTTVSEMGPLLLSRLLGLNEIQEGVLNIAFRVADEEGLLLLDLKDLKAVLHYIGENKGELKLNYGNISDTSIGAIQRALLILENEGAENFFGEPALDINDFFKTDIEGNGFINILHAVKLYQKPNLYSAFLLWFLSELYEMLPETGDAEKPKIVFFFDEAHLLFSEGSKILTKKIEQMIRLIRSKGVSVFFVTQSPDDIPENILGQLGNKIQHALRAFTPKEQKAVRLAAETFRINPSFNTAEVITQLKTGEALVSVLQEDGSPSITQRVLIAPPHSKIGTVDEAKIKIIVEESPFFYKYKESIDRKSAYEILTQQFTEKAENKESNREEEIRLKELKKDEAAKIKEETALIKAETAKLRAETARQKAEEAAKRKYQSTANRLGKVLIDSMTRSVGREITRGIFGSLKKMLK